MMSDIFNLNVNQLTTAGNVGIGTSSPATPLHVFAETNTTQLSLTNTPTSVAPNDIVGSIGFKVVDNNRTSANTDFAYIRTLASQTHTASAAGTTLTFGTTPNNSLIVAERLRITSAGSVGIVTDAPSASAILDAQSTTRAVRMPNMTTTEKNAIASPAAGLIVYDTTLAKLCVYTTAWETITSV